MAQNKKDKEEKLPDLPAASETLPAVIEPAGEFEIKSLFSRSVNGGVHVKAINFKRTLTKPLIAMAHEKELVFTCKSNVYVMMLPQAQRGGEYAPVRVVDGINEATAGECTLMLNELMASAFKRGGYQSYDMAKGAITEEDCTEVLGNSLIGHSFAFREMRKKEGKGYRAIETVEVEITR
jgi:hypothetical protein